MIAKQFGQYEIQEMIDQGAMGIVFRGFDPVVQRTVAIKTLHAHLFHDKEQREAYLQRFFREIRLAGTLNHPNIVTVYSAAEQDGVPYVVMEYVAGETLDGRMTSDKPFTPGEIRTIMTQCCLALDYAHSHGIVHRDIKPANILLPSGELQIKITDFGVARMVDDQDQLTRTQEVVGTAIYMAPEQLSGSGLDGRADLFSLGVIFYQLITGLTPFSGESYKNIFYNILYNEPDYSLEAFSQSPYKAWMPLLQKLLQKEPDKRFQTGKAVCEAWEKIERTKTTVQEMPENLSTAGDALDKTVLVMEKPTVDKDETLLVADKAAVDSDKILQNQDKTASNDVETLIQEGLVPTSALSDRINPKVWVAGLIVILLILLGLGLYRRLGPDIDDTKVTFTWASQKGKILLPPGAMPSIKLGEGFSLTLTPGEKGYFYLLYSDADMNAGFLFPFNEPDRPGNPLEAETTYYFPKKDDAYVLGGNPGREEIHILGAEKPLEQLEAFLNRPELFNVEVMNNFVNSVSKSALDKKRQHIYLHSIYYNLVE